MPQEENNKDNYEYAQLDLFKLTDTLFGIRLDVNYQQYQARSENYFRISLIFFLEFMIYKKKNTNERMNKLMNERMRPK